jgi:hypothetical protein
MGFVVARGEAENEPGALRHHEFQSLGDAPAANQSRAAKTGEESRRGSAEPLPRCG